MIRDYMEFAGGVLIVALLITTSCYRNLALQEEMKRKNLEALSASQRAAMVQAKVEIARIDRDLAERLSRIQQSLPQSNDAEEIRRWALSVR